MPSIQRTNECDTGDAGGCANDHGAKGVRDGEAEVSGAKGDGLCSEGTVGRESAKAASADAEPDPPAPGIVTAVAGETFQECAEQNAPTTLIPSVARGIAAGVGIDKLIA